MKIRPPVASLILWVLLCAGCGLAEKGTHNAGKNCMWPGCHGNEALAWTFAGTVFSAADRSAPAQGVTVIIQGSSGEIRLKTNSAGNFYTLEGDPTQGYSVSISRGKVTRTKRFESANGACNSCHAPAAKTLSLHID
jgi:hypothetical protein